MTVETVETETGTETETQTQDRANVFAREFARRHFAYRMATLPLLSFPVVPGMSPETRAAVEKINALADRGNGLRAEGAQARAAIDEYQRKGRDREIRELIDAGRESEITDRLPQLQSALDIAEAKAKAITESHAAMRSEVLALVVGDYEAMTTAAESAVSKEGAKLHTSLSKLATQAESLRLATSTLQWLDYPKFLPTADRPSSIEAPIHDALAALAPFLADE